VTDSIALRGRLIGIDHGLVRIGVAVSDRIGMTARELLVMTRRSKREDFAQLTQIAAEHQAIGWVVGLPSPYDDVEGVYSQSKKVETWVGYLRETTTLPIVLWDEQLTSVDARALAHQQKRPLRAPVDDLAARVMLSSYLDALHDGLATAPPEWIVS